MPVSSFTKEIRLNAEAARKFTEIQKRRGVKLPHPAADRVEEGREALRQFSPHNNNKKRK